MPRQLQTGSGPDILLKMVMMVIMIVKKVVTMMMIVIITTMMVKGCHANCKRAQVQIYSRHLILLRATHQNVKMSATKQAQLLQSRFFLKSNRKVWKTQARTLTNKLTKMRTFTNCDTPVVCLVTRKENTKYGSSTDKTCYYNSKKTHTASATNDIFQTEDS